MPESGRGDSEHMAEDTTTTDTTAATTDAQGNAIAASGTGAATDAAQTSQDEGKKQDPAVEAALKLLADKGVTVLTERQVNGREAALRRKMEADAATAAETARKETERKALEEQQQFKPLYEQAQAEVQKRDAQIAAMEPVLVSMIEQNTADWDKSLLESKPTEGGYAALAQWYDANKKVAARIAELGTQGKAQQYAMNGGGGRMPTPAGNGRDENAARNDQSRIYKNW